MWQQNRIGIFWRWCKDDSTPIYYVLRVQLHMLNANCLLKAILSGKDMNSSFIPFEKFPLGSYTCEDLYAN